MPPRGFQKTQIPNEMAMLWGLKPSPKGKLGLLVITLLQNALMPRTGARGFFSHAKKKTATKWCMTWDGARGDLKVVGRGWNDGGRIQSTEIRLMYYDISVRNSCAPRRHICRGSLWKCRGCGSGEENLTRTKEKRGKRRNPSVKISASCIKNVCAVRPDFSSRREKDVAAACDSNSNVNRLSKELFFGGCLHSACGICFSQWCQLLAEKRCAWMARTWRYDWLRLDSAKCTNQTQNSLFQGH